MRGRRKPRHFSAGLAYTMKKSLRDRRIYSRQIRRQLPKTMAVQDLAQIMNQVGSIATFCSVSYEDIQAATELLNQC